MFAHHIQMNAKKLSIGISLILMISQICHAQGNNNGSFNGSYRPVTIKDHGQSIFSNVGSNSVREDWYINEGHQTANMSSIDIQETSFIELKSSLPNVFTPDGDLVNDVFLGSEEFSVNDFQLSVYNNWGTRLYNGSHGWDGTYKGAEVPPGTYFYTLKIKNVDGSSKIFKGIVSLIRRTS